MDADLTDLRIQLVAVTLGHDRLMLERDSALARVVELEAALKPLADAFTAQMPTVADCRRAAELLKGVS